MTVAVAIMSMSLGRRLASSSAPSKASTPRSTAFSIKISLASPKSVSDGYCCSGSTRCRPLTLAAACKRRMISSCSLRPGNSTNESVISLWL
ncbi:Uncharacterised protein [Mycobacterium tuberculosis]|uniref:Uncharacterized protein n=1 Tax=Mycobacterium tuberculosis TaxID=1773 RepID=A0A916P781_MYCTX|nr:Uncharacterised protein [Mycobacterium tuberculosis]COY68804.1 Uncharacterised protein [Mycobacterium tuberculosis]